MKLSGNNKNKITGKKYQPVMSITGLNDQGLGMYYKYSDSFTLQGSLVDLSCHPGPREWEGRYSLISRSLHYLKSEIRTVIDEISVMLYRARSKMFRTPFKLLAISSIGIHSFFQKYEFLLRIRMEITDF